MQSVVQLTRDLISFDTVSSRSNIPCIGHIEGILRGMGFQTQHHAMADTSQVNLIAHRGGIKGGLLLSGHSDTVPFRLDQKSTTASFQEGALLYGRGSCDMKGAIAAQLIAAYATKDISLKKPLSLAFTCQEEIGCLGAKGLLATDLLQSEFAIIGEPTSLSPIRMHKGYIGLEVMIRGKASHSSEPANGRSALKGATRALMALEALEARLSGQGYKDEPGAFTPDCCTLNVGVIHGGVARNVIPEVVTFTVELRPLPGQDVEVLIKDVEGCLESSLSEGGFKWQVERHTTDQAMNTPPESPVLAFLQERVGASRAGAVSFGTEGKEFNQMGMESAIFGPGSIQKAHQEDEYVPLDELEASVEHYRAAIEYFCT